MKKGFALVTTLVLLVLLGLLGLAAITFSNLDVRMSGVRRASLESFYGAEAGIEHAKAFLAGLSYPVEPDFNATISKTNYNVSISVLTAGGITAGYEPGYRSYIFRIISVGSGPQSTQRAIEAIIQANPYREGY